jgi:hypothetical protein
MCPFWKLPLVWVRKTVIVYRDVCHLSHIKGPLSCVDAGITIIVCRDTWYIYVFHRNIFTVRERILRYCNEVLCHFP